MNSAAAIVAGCVVPLRRATGIIHCHTSFRIRNILHWSTHVHNTSVVLAHESLVVAAPTRQIRWQRVVPEIYRRLDKIIGQHTTTNDAGIVMTKLRGRDRYAWSNAVEDPGPRYAVRARIQMALQVTSNLIVLVPQSRGM